MSFPCRNLGREGVTLQKCVGPLFCLTGELGLCPVGALCLVPPHPAERGVQAEEVAETGLCPCTSVCCVLYSGSLG